MGLTNKRDKKAAGKAAVVAAKAVINAKDLKIVTTGISDSGVLVDHLVP